MRSRSASENSIKPPEDEDGPIELRHRSNGIGSLVDQHQRLAAHAVGACRRALASVLKELMGPGGGVKPSDIVVLTPRSPRSSWLTGAKVGSWTLVSEFGPEGAPLPPPTSAWEIRLSTVHRFKGLESPVVILAEIDARVPAAQLPGLLYVGATRARTHLVVAGSEEVLRSGGIG